MNSAIWRMGSRHGVVYVDNRDVAEAILACAASVNPAETEMAVYFRNGKRVGWQFRFTLEIWDRVSEMVGAPPRVAAPASLHQKSQENAGVQGPDKPPMLPGKSQPSTTRKQAVSSIHPVSSSPKSRKSANGKGAGPQDGGASNRAPVIQLAKGASLPLQSTAKPASAAAKGSAVAAQAITPAAQPTAPVAKPAARTANGASSAAKRASGTSKQGADAAKPVKATPEPAPIPAKPTPAATKRIAKPAVASPGSLAAPPIPKADGVTPTAAPVKLPAAASRPKTASVKPGTISVSADADKGSAARPLANSTKCANAGAARPQKRVTAPPNGK